MNWRQQTERKEGSNEKRRRKEDGGNKGVTLIGGKKGET